MKNIIYVLIAVSITCLGVCAQAQSISPALVTTNGFSASIGGTTLSWTIGESMNATFHTGNVFLTQGEQQADNNGIVLAGNRPKLTGNCIANTIEFLWQNNDADGLQYAIIQQCDATFNWSTRCSIESKEGSSHSNLPNCCGSSVAQIGYYYRIKQTFADSTNNYSAIIYCKACADNIEQDELTIIPNPNQGSFNLVFSGDYTVIKSISIEDAFGKMVYSESGFQPFITFNHIPNTCYFIKVNGTDFSIVKRLLVIK